MGSAPVIPIWLPVAVPWAGAALLAALPRRPVLAGPAVAAASLAAAVAFVAFGGDGGAAADPLGAALLLSGAVSALLAALAGVGPTRFSAAGLPLLQGAQALALLAADAAVAWVGLAAGVGAGAALLALSDGGRRAVAAAWRMVLLCGAGLASALLGVALLRAGARPASGLPGLGFVLVLLGYGALAGLAPMGAWLPRAVAAAPPPVAAAVAGLLAPAALHAALRAAAAVGPASGELPPAALLAAVGSATALLAAFAAWRRPAPGAPGWSAVGLAGLAAVGFGLGGAAGNLAGVLLVLGLPFCVGAAALGAAAGGPVAASLGRAALAGAPPFAPFAALVLLFSAVAALPAGWALPLGVLLLAAAAAQLGAAVRGAGGPPPLRAGAGRGGLLVAGSAWLFLLFALALGAALPEPVAAALAEAARLGR